MNANENTSAPTTGSAREAVVGSGPNEESNSLFRAKSCPACCGDGYIVYPYLRRIDTCYYCKGEGSFARND